MVADFEIDKGMRNIELLELLGISGRILKVILRNLGRPVRPDLKEALRLTELASGRAALAKLAFNPTSMTLRHLDCGSCNGCELQLTALTNPRYDMERYGISFESSPRHAVYLAMTGPLTRGLLPAALTTMEAMPKPAIIAVGDCAIDGGAFREDGAGSNYALVSPPDEIKNAIVHRIAGCPPTPWRFSPR